MTESEYVTFSDDSEHKTYQHGTCKADTNTIVCEASDPILWCSKCASYFPANEFTWQARTKD